METIHHFIGGQSVPSRSARTHPVFNPATGEQAAEVGLASVDEVDSAVADAAAAFEDWRHTSLAARTKLMYSFRNAVEANAEEIARRLTAEHGKVRSDALGEVARGLEKHRIRLRSGRTAQGQLQLPGLRRRRRLHGAASHWAWWQASRPSTSRPWCRCGCFPNAIACGNTFVLKPSERDPSAPRFVAELFAEAGFPPGVLNVVNGDKVAVDRLLGHPDVKAVSFVGSTPIARYVHESGTAAGKRVQALGGAKNHMVVLPDADIDLAADAAVSAAYGSAGERCMAVSVVVAVGDVADPLVDAIRVRMDKLRIGPGDDPESEMGPLITRDHRDRVAGYVGIGADEGAAVVVDGREARFEGDGFFLGVSLLDHVTPDMSVYRDEIFGPVLCVVRSDTYHEAVDLIDSNPWGNGAAIFTRDGGAARQFQLDADAGMVGVNVPIPVPVGYHSFGGWKQSLFGDTHMYGPEGIHFFTKAKAITTRWPDPADSVVDLGFPRKPLRGRAGRPQCTRTIATRRSPPTSDRTRTPTMRFSKHG